MKFWIKYVLRRITCFKHDYYYMHNMYDGKKHSEVYKCSRCGKLKYRRLKNENRNRLFH